MFARIAGRYDLNNRLHSLWRDQAWRREAVRAGGASRGDRVLDAACGTGDLAGLFARAGAGQVVGVDFCPEMLDAARRKFPRERIRWLPGDATALPLGDGEFDVVSIAFGIRNIADPSLALAEFRRVLRPGGRLLSRWHPFRSRYGAHIHSAIGIPFAHLLFNETDLVRAYCRQLRERYDSLPPTMRPAYDRSTTLDELEYHLNRKTVGEMRAALDRAGFALLERRFYRGTRPVRLPRRLPERWVDYLVDYEVQIRAVR